MTGSFAEFLQEEMTEWEDSISQHEDEMRGLERKLQDRIDMNNVPRLAASCEFYLNQFQLMQNSYDQVIRQMTRQRNKMKELAEPLPKEVESKLSVKQEAIRNRMQELEKNYVDIKYACVKFLAELYKK